MDDPPIPGLRALARAAAPRIPILAFLGLPAALTLPRLGAGRFLYGDDVTQIFYYTSGLLGRSLAAGRLPVWDSHVLCGMPLLASVQYGVLYPPAWLSAVLAPGAFWTLAVAIHLSLSGFFAQAWLARGLRLGPFAALAGSLTFMLSGYLLAQVFGGHLSLVSTYPWAAAVLWRLERQLAEGNVRRAGLLAVAFLMMILAGFPQIAFIASIAVGARLLHFVFSERGDRGLRFRKSLAAAGALALGGLLSAPQMLPTVELTAETQRAVRSFEFSTTYSLPPENLLTLLAPTFFGDSQNHPYWGRWLQPELVGFVGISGLALAALGAFGAHRQRRLWAVLAMAGLVLALGRHTPLYRAYYSLAPWAPFFRAPARHLFLFTLALSPLVAMGMERLLEAEPRVRLHAVRIGAVAGGLFILVLGGALSIAGSGESSSRRWAGVLAFEESRANGEREGQDFTHPEFLRRSRAMAVGSLALASVTLFAVVAALFAARWTSPRRCGIGLGLLLAAELTGFAAWYCVGHEDPAIEFPGPFVDFMRRHPAFPFRVATASPGGVEDAGRCRLAGIDHVGGYEPLLLRRTLELLRAANGSQDTGMAVSVMLSRPGPIADLLGARVWILPDSRPLPAGWRAVGRLGKGVIAENPGALPRAFLAGRSVVIPSDVDRLRFMAGPDFAPEKTVVLDSGPEIPGAAGSPGTVSVRSAEPGAYDLDARCAEDTWLVLTEASYPGWTATVNGAPTPIHRADHDFQAIRLPKGDHAVRFRFRSRSFALGLTIDAIAVLGIAAALALARRRARE